MCFWLFATKNLNRASSHGFTGFFGGGAQLDPKGKCHIKRKCYEWPWSPTHVAYEENSTKHHGSESWSCSPLKTSFCHLILLLCFLGFTADILLKQKIRSILGVLSLSSFFWVCKHYLFFKLKTNQWQKDWNSKSFRSNYATLLRSIGSSYNLSFVTLFRQNISI